MNVALATTWHPHGELPRVLRMLDDLVAFYGGVFIAVPPDNRRDVSAVFEHPAIHLVPETDWFGARYHAVQNALASGAPAIHYCDFDRLLHWLECYPAELALTLDHLSQTDCLIMGRTERAWSTHPRCMIETEIMFNRVFSHLLNSEHLIDFGAGARGFSQRAATHLMQAASPTWGWGIDTAWPLVLNRAGFAYHYLATEGMEWETPDRYRDAAADPETCAAVAAEHDQSAEVWQQRVYVAREMIRVGLLAAEHEEIQTDG